MCKIGAETQQFIKPDRPVSNNKYDWFILCWDAGLLLLSYISSIKLSFSLGFSEQSR